MTEAGRRIISLLCRINYFPDDRGPERLELPSAGHHLWLCRCSAAGTLMAYLINRTLQSGWKRTLPAVFAPLISDGPIAVLCLLILGNLPPHFLQYVRIAGGVFILYLSFRAGMSWKKGRRNPAVAEVSTGRTLFDATVVNFLNPGPYLGWSLVIGPLFLEGWKHQAAYGFSVLAGFYLTMFLFTILIIVLFELARDRGPRVQQILLGLSALFLAMFGVSSLLPG